MRSIQKLNKIKPKIGYLLILDVLLFLHSNSEIVTPQKFLSPRDVEMTIAFINCWMLLPSTVEDFF